MALQAYKIYKINSKRVSGVNTMYDSLLSYQGEQNLMSNIKDVKSAILTPTNKEKFKIIEFKNSFSAKQKLMKGIQNGLKFTPFELNKSGNSRKYLLIELKHEVNRNLKSSQTCNSK